MLLWKRITRSSRRCRLRADGYGHPGGVPDARGDKGYDAREGGPTSGGKVPYVHPLLGGVDGGSAGSASEGKGLGSMMLVRSDGAGLFQAENGRFVVFRRAVPEAMGLGEECFRIPGREDGACYQVLAECTTEAAGRAAFTLLVG